MTDVCVVLLCVSLSLSVRGSLRWAGSNVSCVMCMAVWWWLKAGFHDNHNVHSFRKSAFTTWMLFHKGRESRENLYELIHFLYLLKERKERMLFVCGVKVSSLLVVLCSLEPWTFCIARLSVFSSCSVFFKTWQHFLCEGFHSFHQFLDHFIADNMIEE